MRIVSPGVQGKDKKKGSYCGVYVRENSSIDKPEDLQGKTIAVNTLRNIGPVTIKTSLQKSGVGISTTKYTEVPFPDMLKALNSGAADAVWVCEPFATQAQQKGARQVLANYVQTASHLSVATYFVNGDWADEHQGTVEAFSRAMRKSLKYASTHPKEVRDVITTYTKVDKGTAQQLTLPVWSTHLNRSTIRLLAQRAKKYGLIKNTPDPQKLVRQAAPEE